MCSQLCSAAFHFPTGLQIAALLLLLLPLLYSRIHISLSLGQIQLLPKERSILSFFRPLYPPTLLLQGENLQSKDDENAYCLSHRTVTLSQHVAIIFATLLYHVIQWHGLTFQPMLVAASRSSTSTKKFTFQSH